jgi:hypothetical protein
MKIRPKVPQPRKDEVNYAHLKDGTTFIYRGSLCFKADVEGHQLGICLGKSTEGDCSGVDWYDEMCGQMVVPVDVELKWSYKKQPSKKKPKK